jgi:oxygen-independent coproporphyrinogen III oxidase
MSGIYIHIPFCKQACHYCDFHFSTSLKKKDEMVLAIAKEMAMRKKESQTEIETIYFGGGTPSILEISDIDFLISKVYQHYNVAQNPEITIEANPDDLTKERIVVLSNSPVNRLSIGVQSFFETDLQLMNRAHNSKEAKRCLEIAVRYFDNISVDLIYGIPGLTNQQWLQNIQTVLDLKIPHISSYALTVEPKTALQKLITEGLIPPLDDAIAHEQFLLLVDTLEKNNFIHYELSNFGKKGYFSRNNTAYWLGKKYIGIGPSAHSYDGQSRSWNVSNNALYLKSLEENKLPSETEILSKTDQYNEYVMTGLRTIWGISLENIETHFGKNYSKYLLKNAQKHIDDDQLILNNNILKTTRKGKFFCDGMASDLFYLNLE